MALRDASTPSFTYRISLMNVPLREICGGGHSALRDVGGGLDRCHFGYLCSSSLWGKSCRGRIGVDRADSSASRFVLIEIGRDRREFEADSCQQPRLLWDAKASP